MSTPKVGRLTNISHNPVRFLHFRPVQQIVNYCVLTQAVPRINLIKISHSQMSIFVIFITFITGEFQC